MTLLAKLTALGSAAVVTATAASVAWFAAGSAPLNAAGTSTFSPQDPVASGLIVCVGQDSVLRAVPANPGCLPGQTQLPLTPESNAPVTPSIINSDDDTPNGSSPPFKNDRLGDLERRIAELEKTPLFTVVDKEGHVIFEIVPNGLLLYNANGRAMVGARATSDGGFFRAISADATTSVSEGVSATFAGFRLKQGDATRVELGRQPSGQYSLRFPSGAPSGTPIAGIGESKAGSGALVVATSTGAVMASMTAGDGRGAFSIFNSSGINLASLRQSEAGGGILSLGDSGGLEVVKMVVNENRYGAVLTGPRAGFPWVPSSGLPGSYFLGCAGGPRCYGY